MHTTSSSTAFILAGSGTFGWDQVGANVIEPGDRVLVIHTGYFGDGFKDWYVSFCNLRYGQVLMYVVL